MLHRAQAVLLHQADGQRGTLGVLVPPVRVLGGGGEVAQADGEFPQSVVGDLLAARQIQVLEGQAGSKRRPAAPEEGQQLETNWGSKGKTQRLLKKKKDLPVKCKICHVGLGQVQVGDVGTKTENLTHLKR